ncbi:MAG: hypothetical protein Kow0090_09680 [Myxococcota bacterium]
MGFSRASKRVLGVFAVVTALFLSLGASGQMQDPMQGTLNNAIASYEGGDFAEAAMRFYDAYSGATTPLVFQTAEYYLGRSLMKLDLLQPALYFLSRVLNAGASHKYFLDAAAAVVSLKERLNDDSIIPHYLNEAYSPDFAQIPPDVLYQINYTVGAYQFRGRQYESAAQFLQAVDPKSPAYPRAQYLLGMIAFRAQNESQALEYFEEANRTSKGSFDPGIVRIYWLSTMALARTHYQMGNYERADELYASVPRFTDDWLDSIFEQAWAFFQRNELGRALGNVHTLLAPQFADHYWPEAVLLAATAYFYSCNYGLAEETLAKYYENYEPMRGQMEKFMASPQSSFEIYYNLVANPWSEDKTPIPRKIHNYIAHNKRFKRFKSMVTRIDNEKQKIESTPMLMQSRMGNEVLGIITLLRQKLVEMSGQFAYSRMKYVTETLQGFYNQAALIKFEIQNAQKKSILGGKDEALNILRDVEALPRPKMPADYKYYHFNGEYWVDELGYYVYTLSQNCPEEGD